jgi:hypothetical protein
MTTIKKRSAGKKERENEAKKASCWRCCMGIFLQVSLLFAALFYDDWR